VAAGYPLAVDTYAVPQNSSGLLGVHLTWCGPRAWVYAPDGFTVQRRVARPPSARHCARLDAVAIDELRRVREQRLPFGVVMLRDGGWLNDLDDLDPGAEASHTPTEVFRVDLDTDHRVVEVTVDAKLSFVTALHGGRVVGAAGPEAGPASHRIRAPRLDSVVAHTLDPTSLRVCVDFVEDPTGAPPDDWQGVAPIVTGLTMPFRELMSALHSDADEFAEARSRLLPGEDIGADEFARLAAVMRPMLTAAQPPRPSELSLCVREDPAGAADEARALDPLRLMLAHPTWRRVLGFGVFDDDPALVPGDTYEYRVSATYPAPDVHDENHGFATVPSGTLLPAEFALGRPRVRVPRPETVGLTPGTPDSGLVRITRRGIQLDPTRESFWIGPGLDEWSLVVDFDTPVSAVVLELAPGHDLVYSAGAAIGSFLDVDPVPAVPTPRIDFGAPVEQLRLRGKGFLHALRVPTVADTDKAELAVVTPPVTLVDTPLPAPPLAAWAASLQQPTAAPTSLVPAAEVALRDALGFTVTWRPAPAFDLTAWPPDLEAAVPLDATVFQIERRVEPTGDWVPVLDDDNQTLGDRGSATRELTLAPGVDLATVFPDDAVLTSGVDLDLHFVDSFDVVDAPLAGAHAAPEPGSLHRYRVRTIDSVGRPSADWRETAPVRLEKHVPPPVPVRVDARVLVPDAPDLTADERALLGTSDSAVLVRWQWGQDQRDQDPFATEFRIYAAPPMDSVAGTVTAVTQLSSGQVTSYRVDVQLDVAIAVDLVAGQRLDAGHPFFIRSHDAGSAIQMVVETRLRPGGVAPVPILGPVSLALPLTPDRTRPPAWGTRQAVVPIDTDPAVTEYEVVLRDLLAVTDTDPAARAWVGVSTADDQGYVADQLAPLDSRPGNESAIVPVQAVARYHGRPELEIPPPLAPVPRVRTPEPGPDPVHFTLDLTPYLPSAAMTAGRVRTERVAVAAVLAACRLTDDDHIMAVPVAPPGGDDQSSVESEVEIPIANPGDRAELAAQIRSGRSEVDDRFAVYLAGRHAYRDRLFAPVADALQPPGPFAETLPSSTGRYVYRVRAADQAGHVSAGAATAAVVVRVPSLRQGAPPLKLPSSADDPPATLRVQVAPDAELTHLVVFTAPITGIGAVATGEIMRVPNRPDLLPAGGLFLRSPEGALLSPTAIVLDEPPAEGGRTVLVPVPGDPGDRTRIWLATLTADGVPSPVAGPYSLVHSAAVPS
jgi:hypothetical protein